MFWKRSTASLDAATKRIDDLEADNRRLRAEWADIYDKLMHMADRINKRTHKLVLEKQPENDGNSPDLNTPEGIMAAARRQGYV